MMTDAEREEYVFLGLILLVPMCVALFLDKCLASYILIGYSMFGYTFLQVRYWYNEYREYKGKEHVKW